MGGGSRAVTIPPPSAGRPLSHVVGLNSSVLSTDPGYFSWPTLYYKNCNFLVPAAVSKLLDSLPITYQRVLWEPENGRLRKRNYAHKKFEV